MDSAPPRRGLGQGLALLLGEPQTRAHGSLREIPIDQITPNPRQPRARIDEERFAELVESVRRDGIVQPVLVRGVGAGWELIAGERRWRAAQAAGLTTVPALVREADDRTSLALALVENIVRADLDPGRAGARLRPPAGRVRALARGGRDGGRPEPLGGRQRDAPARPARRGARAARARRAERGPRPGAAADRGAGRAAGGGARRRGRRVERAPGRGAGAHPAAAPPRAVRRRRRTGSTPSSRTTRSTASTARSASPRASRPTAPAAASSCACARPSNSRASSSASRRSTPRPRRGVRADPQARRPAESFLVSSAPVRAISSVG